MKALYAGALLASLSLPVPGSAQDMAYEVKPKSYIAYLADVQTIPAGKNVVVELHFKVQNGFHVNSHTPKSDYLLPTKLELGSAAGVQTAGLEYPPGTVYRLNFEPNEKLDVYSGVFTLKLTVMATAGEHKLAGTLRYQACDQAACYPPKALPVEVLLAAK